MIVIYGNHGNIMVTMGFETQDLSVIPFKCGFILNFCKLFEAPAPMLRVDYLLLFLPAFSTASLKFYIIDKTHSVLTDRQLKETPSKKVL